MTVEPSLDGPDVVHLPVDLNHCRHGHELRLVIAVEDIVGWTLWGYHSCLHCERMPLQFIPKRPAQVHVAGRRLEVHHKGMQRAESA